MGHFYNVTPPTNDLDELEEVLKKLNKKLFGTRFRVERLPKALGLKAKWAFYCTEEGWTDAFMAPALRPDGQVEIRCPAWGWDEVILLKKAIARLPSKGSPASVPSRKS